ncbi:MULTISPECIES: DUF2474 family protein [unclassified Phenylobacterium]
MAAPSSSSWRRLAWFVGLWLAGVLTVGAVSYLLRAWLL